MSDLTCLAGNNSSIASTLSHFTALTMPKQEGEDLLQTLVSAFQDANLGNSRYRGIPFVQDETAQSYLFRIIDF
jgi:hypothetical protein